MTKRPQSEARLKPAKRHRPRKSTAHPNEREAKRRDTRSQVPHIILEKESNPKVVTFPDDGTFTTKELWQKSVSAADGLDTQRCRVVKIRFLQGWELDADGKRLSPAIRCEVDILLDGEQRTGTLEGLLSDKDILSHEEFEKFGKCLLIFLWREEISSHGEPVPSEYLDHVYSAIANVVQKTRPGWPTFEKWPEAKRIASFLSDTPLVIWFLKDCYVTQPELRKKILNDLQSRKYAGLYAPGHVDSLGQFWATLTSHGDADANASANANAARIIFDILLDVGVRENLWPRLSDRQSERFASQLPENAQVQFLRFEKRELAEKLRTEAMSTRNSPLRLKAAQALYECDLDEMDLPEAKLEFLGDVLATLPEPWQFERDQQLRWESHDVALDSSQVPALRRWLEKKTNEYAQPKQQPSKAEPRLLFEEVWHRMDGWRENLERVNRKLIELKFSRERVWIGTRTDLGFFIRDGKEMKLIVGRYQYKKISEAGLSIEEPNEHGKLGVNPLSEDDVKGAYDGARDDNPAYKRTRSPGSIRLRDFLQSCAVN